MRVDVVKVQAELGTAEPVPPGTVVRAVGFILAPCAVLLGLICPVLPWTEAWSAGILMGAAAVLGLALGLTSSRRIREEEGDIFVGPFDDDEGLVLGVTPEREVCTWPDRDSPRHMAVVGSSGAGKTASMLSGAVLWPKILRNAAVVIIDAKPEDESLRQVVWMCKAARRLDDLRVLQVDRAKQSHTCNVLEGLTLLEQVDVLTSLRPVKDSSTTVYYGQAQYDAVLGIVAALHDTGLPYHIGDVVAAIVSSGAREELLGMGSRGGGISDGARQLQMVMDDFRKGRSFDEERWQHELKGIVVTLRKYIRASQDIVLHEHGEIDFYRVLRDGGIVYLPLPVGQSAEMARAMARLVLKLLISACGRIIREGTQPRIPAVAALDELGTYCSDNAAFAFGWARAANTSLIAAYQTDAQLRHESPELAGIIAGNTFYKVFMQHGDEAAALEAADQIGKAPQIQRSYSMSSTQGTSSRSGLGGAGGRTQGTNEGVSMSGRVSYEHKVRSEEIRSLPQGAGYVAWQGEYALVKAPYFKVPEDDLLELDELVSPKRGRIGYRFGGDGRPGVGLWKRYEREVDEKIGKYERKQKTAKRREVEEEEDEEVPVGR